MNGQILLETFQGWLRGSIENKGLAMRFSADKAAMAQNIESLITYVKDRLGNYRRYVIDATKTNNELNYKLKELFD